MAASLLTGSGIARSIRRPRRLQVTAAVALLALWEIVATSAPAGGKAVPHLRAVAAAFASLLIEPSFYGHLLTTVLEVSAATAIALAAAVLVTLAVSRMDILVAGVATVCLWLAPTPKIIFFPIALSAFGVDVGSKIFIGTLSAFFPIAISMLAGIRGVERIYREVAATFGMTALQLATKIYVPAIWVSTMTGLRLGAGLAIIGVLLSETKLSSSGLGYLAQQSYAAFRTDELYAIILVTFALALALNVLVSRLETRGRQDMRTGPQVITR